MELSWLPIPRKVIEAHALVLQDEVWHRPLDMAQGPDGRVWILSRLMHNYPERHRFFQTYLLSTYTAEGTHLQTREVPALHEALHERVLHDDGRVGSSITMVPQPALLVDAGGLVIVTASSNQTLVYTPDLELVRAYSEAYETLHEKRSAASNFAATIEILPSGRWLCAVGERVGSFVDPSIAALSEGIPQLAAERPTLRYVTSLWPFRDYHELEERRGQFPYVLLEGAPFHHANRPQPTVGECAITPFGRDRRGMRLRALDDERFVASWYQRIPRSHTGFAKNYFGFACFTPKGEVLEHIDASKFGTDHPFVPVDHPHHTYAVMRGLDAIAFKNRFAVYLLRFGGEMQRVDLTASKAMKTLQPFRLLGVTREGRQVWSHDEHQTALWTDALRTQTDFEPAIIAAAQGYRRAWTHIKKDGPLVDGHWLDPA